MLERPRRYEIKVSGGSHVDTDMLCIPTITHFWKNRIRGESEREEERDWFV